MIHALIVSIALSFANAAPQGVPMAEEDSCDIVSAEDWAAAEVELGMRAPEGVSR